jgi:serine/threonine protein kinase
MRQATVDNRYSILDVLGGGGMGIVYLARDEVLDRQVALKVLRNQYTDSEEFVERFRREAQSAAALSHPNIVSIFDRGETEDGTYYIAMEYLSGGTLKDRIIEQGALPARTAIAVALQVAEALGAAHGRGVIHRDIKPQNVMVGPDGDVKVTDFGIARASSASTMTGTSVIVGTAHYISPEQAMAEPVGPQSDLYSLGVVLYEMLTGELPYDADTPIGIAMKHVNDEPPSPRATNPEVSEDLEAITLGLLAREPAGRYGSADELAADLKRVMDGRPPIAARGRDRSTTLVAPAREIIGENRAREIRRRRILSRVAASLFAVGTLLAVATLWDEPGRATDTPLPRMEQPSIGSRAIEAPEAAEEPSSDEPETVSATSPPASTAPVQQTSAPAPATEALVPTETPTEPVTETQEPAPAPSQDSTPSAEEPEPVTPEPEVPEQIPEPEVPEQIPEPSPPPAETEPAVPAQDALPEEDPAPTSDMEGISP